MAAATAMMRPFGWGMEDASAAAFLERLGPMLLMAGLELRAPDAGRRFTAAVCAAGSAGAHAAFEAAVAALPLLPPRVALPRDIAEACCASSVPRDRVRCSLGMSMHDLLAVMAAEEGGSLLPVCDWVLFPRTEGDVAAVLRYASAAGLAVVTRGGGTSVTGGLAVDARGRSGVVCLDMRRLSGVVSVDAEAMTARVLGGTTGPDLEAALRPYGLTARHFPQSFEYATVGGMVATRNGGHFASGPTKVDDICLAVRLVTPDAGVIASSLTVPSSGAPSLVRLVCGSEGTLGVISEVTLRLRSRDRATAACVVTFDSFAGGADCVRSIMQLELLPSNCRLVSDLEALAMGLGDGASAVLLLAFEAPAALDEAPVVLRAKIDAAVRVCRGYGGTLRRPVKVSLPGKAAAAAAGPSATREGEMGEWRSSFISAPYLREALLVRGVIVETFETAVTWSGLVPLVQHVTTAVSDAIQRVTGQPGLITVRLTHVYASGGAPYFTVVMQGGRTARAMAEQWAAVKAAASSAIEAAGGTCSHHHAVGTDHLPYFEREVGGFVRALAGAKAALDHAWCLNPGVLLRPPQALSAKL